MRLVSWNARSNVCRHTIKCRLLFIWTSAFQLLSMRLNFYFIILFNIVQDSLGYGFIPAFRQAGSKQKSDRAVLFHRLVFTSVLGLRHFRNTGRYIRIVTGLLLMQICGLNWPIQHILFFFLFSFKLYVFLWFIVANRSSRETSVVFQNVFATKEELWRVHY